MFVLVISCVHQTIAQQCGYVKLLSLCNMAKLEITFRGICQYCLSLFFSFLILSLPHASNNSLIVNTIITNNIMKYFVFITM